MPESLATITITLYADGQTKVVGPIEQTMLCYGLLEVAKDLVRSTNEARKQTIQTPGTCEVLAFGKRE